MSDGDLTHYTPHEKCGILAVTKIHGIFTHIFRVCATIGLWHFSGSVERSPFSARHEEFPMPIFDRIDINLVNPVNPVGGFSFTQASLVG